MVVWYRVIWNLPLKVFFFSLWATILFCTVNGTRKCGYPVIIRNTGVAQKRLPNCVAHHVATATHPDKIEISGSNANPGCFTEDKKHQKRPHRRLFSQSKRTRNVVLEEDGGRKLVSVKTRNRPQVILPLPKHLFAGSRQPYGIKITSIWELINHLSNAVFVLPMPNKKLSVEFSFWWRL